MTLRPHWNLATLVLITILFGCAPTAEGPRDEQKNPFYLAGKDRLQAMDYQGAVESFERALQENSRSVLAHYELGVVYDQHLADYAAALYHYSKALKLRPSGYPADNIRYRIPACRQELVKADSLAVVNPSALRETEKLREENQALRRQIGELKAAHAAFAASPNRTPPSGSVSFGTGRGVTNTISDSGRSLVPAPGTSGAGQSLESAGRPAGDSNDALRQHTIRPGETLASVSRSYNVRLDALLSANRGLDPKRLKVGQTVKVPLR